MATFMEAMHAARNGKRVRRGPGWNWCIFRSTVFCSVTESENKLSQMVLTDGMLDNDWEIEQPSRNYTFMEAVEMMKRGKVMRSPNNISTIYDPISTYFYSTCGVRSSFLMCEIDGKWTEVEP